MEDLDDTLKIRLPSTLKRRLKEAADADPDAGDLSKWVRRQLRVGERIARQKRET
jgi:hypothetical protein